jgi:hypothetical protein
LVRGEQIPQEKEKEKEKEKEVDTARHEREVPTIEPGQFAC